MIDPLTIVVVLILLAAVCIGGAGACLLSLQSKSHPSIEARRKELEIQVKLGNITPDEYADQTTALDREAEEANLRRREQ